MALFVINEEYTKKDMSRILKSGLRHEYKVSGSKPSAFEKKKDHEEINNKLKSPGFDSDLKYFNSRENIKAKRNRASFFNKK